MSGSPARRTPSRTLMPEAPRSLADLQPRRAQVGDVGVVVDLPLAGGDVVVRAQEAHEAVLDDDAAGARVAVARLPHRAHVDDGLLAAPLVVVVELARVAEAQVLGEHP